MPAHNISQEITQELIRTILADCETADLVAFDEAQFFSEGLLELTLGLLDRKKQVMIAGLNLDYLGRPFGCIGQLLLHADEVIVKKAYCKCCGRPAMYTQRVIDGQPVTARNLDSELVLIGDQESYEARCPSVLCEGSRRDTHARDLPDSAGGAVGTLPGAAASGRPGPTDGGAIPARL